MTSESGRIGKDSQKGRFGITELERTLIMYSYSFLLVSKAHMSNS